MNKDLERIRNNPEVKNTKVITYRGWEIILYERKWKNPSWVQLRPAIIYMRGWYARHNDREGTAQEWGEGIDNRKGGEEEYPNWRCVAPSARRCIDEVEGDPSTEEIKEWYAEVSSIFQENSITGK